MRIDELQSEARGEAAAGEGAWAALRFDRREVLGGLTLLAAGLALRPGGARADSTAGGLANVKGGDASPRLFIRLLPEGAVEITCHRSEMGQHTWTAMAQILADELEADWQDVRIVQAEGHPRYGDQNTDGSRSVRRNFHRLRVCGAALRHQLERAAAELWGVDQAEVRAEQSFVVHAASGRRRSFGDLSSRAAKLGDPAERDVDLKSRAAWRYIARPMPSLTAPAIVRGEGTFGIDVRLPDMLHAVALRPPQTLGKVKRFDDAAAKAVPGVVATVRLPDAKDPVGFAPLGGVAVVAKDTWSAMQGRDALEVDWEPGPNGAHTSSAFEETLTAAAKSAGEVRRRRGDVEKALGEAARLVAADYYVPHLAQAPMEPPVATARWTEDGQVECWACVQAPQTARKTVAGVCGVPEEKVTIHVTWLGGGFGRKSKPDFVAEAALVARAVKRPVKLTWTREDDLRHGYLHTVSAQHLEGGLDAEGRVTACLHRTVFPPIASTFASGADNPSWGELRLGASDNPFAVPNLRLESGRARAHLRTGWLRSVANIYHAFALQSFAAELAHAAGRDPKDMLLELIGPPRTFDPNEEGAKYDNYGDPLDAYPIDTGRLAHVTRKAADMADWGRARPKGHGLGIAAHRSFLSYVATVVEVAVDDDGRITLPKVWTAIDAGTVVNPNHTASQVEGGTLYGLSNALYGEITAEGGAVVQANFPDWRIMRMSEAPRDFEVHIVASDAPPGGVGEPPTPPAAPALANALFAATGRRFRRLPILGPRRDRLGPARDA